MTYDNGKRDLDFRALDMCVDKILIKNDFELTIQDVLEDDGLFRHVEAFGKARGIPQETISFYRTAHMNDSLPMNYQPIHPPQKITMAENGTSIQATEDIRTLVPMRIRSESESQDVIVFVHPDTSVGELKQLAREAYRHIVSAECLSYQINGEDTDD